MQSFRVRYELWQTAEPFKTKKRSVVVLSSDFWGDDVTPALVTEIRRRFEKEAEQDADVFVLMGVERLDHTVVLDESIDRIAGEIQWQKDRYQGEPPASQATPPS